MADVLLGDDDDDDDVIRVSCHSCLVLWWNGCRAPGLE